MEGWRLFPNFFKTFTGPVRSFSFNENHISSAVTEILRYRHNKLTTLYNWILTWISRRFSLLAMLPTSISILLISWSFRISTLLLRDLSPSPQLRSMSTEADRVSLPLTRCSAMVWTTKRASVARRISSCNTNVFEVNDSSKKIK